MPRSHLKSDLASAEPWWQEHQFPCYKYISFSDNITIHRHKGYFVRFFFFFTYITWIKYCSTLRISILYSNFHTTLYLHLFEYFKIWKRFTHASGNAVIYNFLSSMCIAEDKCNKSQTNTVFRVTAEYCTALLQRAAWVTGTEQISGL